MEKVSWIQALALVLPLSMVGVSTASAANRGAGPQSVVAATSQATSRPSVETLSASSRAPAARVSQTLREEERILTTADGWDLAIHRVAPGTVLYSEPILMIHGLCSNYATWDLNNTQSIQRYLANLGFDTWALDLRGAGDSEAPPPGHYEAWEYSIDDFIHYDAPAALNFVLAQTGASKAFVMGHSMGGLITYGMLETEPVSSKVAGIVTLAGAVLMGSDGSGENPATQAMLSLIGLISPFVIDDTVVPAEDVAYIAANVPGASWMLEAFAKWAGVWIWNPRNVSVELIDQMANKAVGDTNTNVLQQFTIFSHKYDSFSFAGWTGKAPASDYYVDNGFVSYVNLLPNIKVPALVLSGGGDRLVGAHNIKTAYNKLGSTDKFYLEVGKNNGFTYDYGHVDLVMGTMAPTEVYPILGTWLEARAH